MRNHPHARPRHRAPGALRPAGRRLAAGLAAAMTALATIAVVSVGPASGAVVADATVDAATYAHAHGYNTGVAVLDTSTGRFYGGGSYNSVFASESVVKVFIATELLVSGRMHGAAARTAYKMVTQSDDASASALYGRVGGDGLINWIKKRYHVPFLGSPPSQSGWWGNTHITARGMVYFYAAVKKDHVVWPWLGNAMHHATVHGSDGTYQFFGIPSATSGAAIKQGWGADDNCGCHSTRNSTGLVNADRYAVAILTSATSRANASITGVLTGEARILLPGGRIDLPQYHDPRSSVSYVHLFGSTVHIGGAAIDPDYPQTQLTVAVYEGAKLIESAKTDVFSASINARYRAWHATGEHRFRFSFVAPNAAHTYCVVTTNLGEGTADPKRCTARVTVDGSPSGHVDSVTAATDRSVTLTGWALDPDQTSTSSPVTITRDGAAVASFVTSVSRPDVNKAHHVTGNHGYVVALASQAPGTAKYCVDAVNIGPTIAPNRALGCVSVSVPAPAP